MDIGEGFDHVGDGEGFGAVPVDHAVCDGKSGDISLGRIMVVLKNKHQELAEMTEISFHRIVSILNWS